MGGSNTIRFLGKNYRKIEEVIRVLSISDKWITKKEFIKYIGSSGPTFIRYIEEIKQRWGESLTTKTSHELSYRLENFNVSLYLNVLTDMAKTSAATQLLHGFIQNPDKAIEYYCDTVNISRSSSARKSKQCNQVLEAYSLHIIVDQGYQLTSQAEELPLCIFTTFFFLIYYGHCELPYQLDKQEIRQLMRRNQCQLNIISMDNSYEHDFFIMCFIIDLLREHQGFQQCFQKEADKKSPIKMEDYLLLSRHFTELNRKTYREVLRYFQRDAFRQCYSENQEAISQRVRENLKFNALSQIEQLTEEVVDFAVHLLICLYLFSQLVPFDTSGLTQRATLFAQQIHFAQLHLYVRLEAELHFFSALLETSLLNYPSSYIFWLLNTFPEINQSFGSKKILIISDMGLNHGQYIGNYVHDISALHRIRSNTLAITEEQLGDHRLEGSDLITTNQPTTGTSVPSILVNDVILFFNKRELLDLLNSQRLNGFSYLPKRQPF